MSTLSWSQLETWSRCGLQFDLRYNRRVERRPSGALIGGIAVHSAVEAIERKGEPTNAALAKHAFERSLLEQLERVGGPDHVRWAGRKSRANPAGEDLKWWMESGPMMLRRYAAFREREIAEGARVLPESVEMRVEAWLPTGRQITGRIDSFVFVTPDGEARVRDVKSGQAGRGTALQLAIYRYAAQQSLGLDIWEGEYLYVRASDPTRFRRVVDLRPLEPVVLQMFEGFERGLRSGVYPMVPDDTCARWCDVAQHCAWGKTAQETEAS